MKFKSRARRATAVVVAALLATPARAMAAPTGQADLDQSVERLRVWLVGMAFSLATIALVVGGLYYAASAGDPSKAERAKLAFKGAVGGYALAVFAPAILNILRGIVGG